MGMESALPHDVFNNSNSGSALYGGSKPSKNLGIESALSRNDHNIGQSTNEENSMENTNNPGLKPLGNTNAYDSNSSAANFLDGQVDRFGTSKDGAN